MEYIFADDLEKMLKRGKQQAKDMRREVGKLARLLEENPDLPLAGCAFVNSWHARDGSVTLDYSFLSRVAVGGEHVRDKELWHWIGNASPDDMRAALRAIMRGEEIDSLDSATEAQLRDWYNNAIPWTDVVYCEFSGIWEEDT